jgi:hypothetical protein
LPSRAVFVVIIQPPSGRYVVQPGNGHTLLNNPLPAPALKQSKNKPKAVYGQKAFAARALAQASFKGQEASSLAFKSARSGLKAAECGSHPASSEGV